MQKFITNPGAAVSLLFGLVFMGRIMCPIMSGHKMNMRVIIKSLTNGNILCLDATMMMFTSAVVKMVFSDHEGSNVCLIYALYWVIAFFVTAAFEYRWSYRGRSGTVFCTGRRAWLGVWGPNIVGIVLVLQSMRIILRG
jgi:hypothetical protein